jgi:hypothetical protein
VSTASGGRSYAYKRLKGDEEVFVILNLEDSEQNISFPDLSGSTDYVDVFSGEDVTIDSEGVALDAHRYLVLEK